MNTTATEHECVPADFIDPEVEVAICTVCGAQTGRSDLT